MADAPINLDPKAKKHRFLRNYFIAGLLVWLPILITLLVIRFIVDILDRTLSLLPAAYRPDQLLGFHIPGLGVILSVVVVLSTGVLATNFIGHHLVRAWEAVLARIPLVRNIYQAVKQVLTTLFSSGSQSFRKVLLVKFPHGESWTLAFQTGGNNQHIDEQVGKDLITVFVPATPNPTAGFLLLVAKEDTYELKMSIDEALKMILSLGVVQPTANINPDIVNNGKGKLKDA